MITVIFASYNGERTLPLMLDSLCQITPPKNGWKLVIVDNNSTDNTAKIIKQYQEKLPITYLLETKKGKNHALNKGIQYIEGDFVVFTDDDIIADKNWLLEMENAAKSNPDYAMFGGVIKPHWPTPPKPYHFFPNIQSACFALTPEKLQEGKTPNGTIWGPNMAVRSFIFTEKELRYDPNIGPNGSKSYPMGSESEFLQRLHYEGIQGYHVSNSIVQHIVRPNQMQKKWLLERAFRAGKGAVSLEALEPNANYLNTFRTLAGVPVYMLKQLLKRLINFVFCLCQLDFDNSFYQRWQIYLIVGEISMFRFYYKHGKPNNQHQ